MCFLHVPSCSISLFSSDACLPASQLPKSMPQRFPFEVWFCSGQSWQLFLCHPVQCVHSFHVASVWPLICLYEVEVCPSKRFWIHLGESSIRLLNLVQLRSLGVERLEVHFVVCSSGRCLSISGWFVDVLRVSVAT